jgi:predicted alpha/beta hydrolase
MPATHTIAMQNGTSVVLRAFEPSTPVRASLVLPSAMGVAQHFYAKFAEWLAGQGYFVVTFDYRGIGLSAPASLRGASACPRPRRCAVST